MTEGWLGQLLHALKLSPRYMVVVATVSAAFLFLPPNRLQQLGLVDIAGSYRGWFGFAFLISAATTAVAMGIWIGRTLGRWRNNRTARAYMLKKLARLTEGEKQILRYYLAKDSRSNSLRFGDGEVRELEHCGIIYRAANTGSLAYGFAYNINDLAWDHLHAHPHLLKGTTNTYRTDARGW